MQGAHFFNQKGGGRAAKLTDPHHPAEKKGGKSTKNIFIREKLSTGVPGANRVAVSKKISRSAPLLGQGRRPSPLRLMDLWALEQCHAQVCSSCLGLP